MVDVEGVIIVVTRIIVVIVFLVGGESAEKDLFVILSSEQMLDYLSAFSKLDWMMGCFCCLDIRNVSFIG